MLMALCTKPEKVSGLDVRERPSAVTFPPSSEPFFRLLSRLRRLAYANSFIGSLGSACSCYGGRGVQLCNLQVISEV